VIPSQEDQRRYARELRAQAEQGDPFAKAAMIMIARFESSIRTLQELKHG
jgi:hypothetical protein